MMHPSPEPDLPEDLAHRVLARAIELDARHDADVSMARLREVALETGISSRALEQALAEARVPTAPPAPRPGLLARAWRRLAGSHAAPAASGWLDAILGNATAFAAAWLLGFLLGRAGDALTGAWFGESAGVMLGTIAGTIIARRQGARLSALVLGVVSVAMVSEFVLHLIYGIDRVQGAATHFAVLLASLLGVALGAAWSRNRASRSGSALATAEANAEPNPARDMRKDGPIAPLTPLRTLRTRA